jgi:hypothetical protein
MPLDRVDRLRTLKASLGASLGFLNRRARLWAIGAAGEAGGLSGPGSSEDSRRGLPRPVSGELLPEEMLDQLLEERDGELDRLDGP